MHSKRCARICWSTRLYLSHYVDRILKWQCTFEVGLLGRLFQNVLLIMNGCIPSLRYICLRGCLTEGRVNSPFEQKLNFGKISCYLDYLKKSNDLNLTILTKVQRFSKWVWPNSLRTSILVAVVIILAQSFFKKSM